MSLTSRISSKCQCIYVPNYFPLFYQRIFLNLPSISVRNYCFKRPLFSISRRKQIHNLSFLNKIKCNSQAQGTNIKYICSIDSTCCETSNINDNKETIFALSSAYGKAGVAVIRLSGEYNNIICIIIGNCIRIKFHTTR